MSPSPSSHPPSPSPYTSDPLLQPFLSPTFDPTAYLNSTLPILSFSTTPSKASNVVSLSELATQTQTHVAQLSAQTSRLTTTLTALTDDIIRSGSRLAYEVEVLRGEAISLSETLTETLKPDIEKFVPGGLTVQSHADAAGSSLASPDGTRRSQQAIEDTPEAGNGTDPEALTSLRTLHHVRLSLQSIISIFDAALSWPLPPSTLSISSSLISVTSPSTDSHPSQEAAGQEAFTRFKNEINDLLAIGPEDGVLAAEKRVEELRELVGVWKGTVEEKPRMKFVDGLARTVAERRREVEAKGGLKARERASTEAGLDGSKATGEAGKGFLGNLQRLREEIYLD
ncbi:hypothetical protein MMC26_001968 [Xylographa opegraphella]|nr:hypothetical protein [Xylographa opegraphella]